MWAIDVREGLPADARRWSTQVPIYSQLAHQRSHSAHTDRIGQLGRFSILHGYSTLLDAKPSGAPCIVRRGQLIRPLLQALILLVSTRRLVPDY